MTSGHNGIVHLVRAATVVVTGEKAGRRVPVGSGFFVAPGWVLSCAHVVAGTTNPGVLWRGHALVPNRVQLQPAEHGPDTQYAFPDAALLQVDIPDGEPELCVPITTDPPAVKDQVWVYGFNGVRVGRPERDGSLLTVTDATPGQFIRVERGQLAAGMSGGPVLNLNTYAVCGMAKATQLEGPALGGWITSIADALSIVDEPLAERNAAFHADTLPVLRAGQVILGALPKRVQALLTDYAGAVELLRQRLQPPETVAAADVPEWVARQLFRLSLEELAATLLSTRGTLDPERMVVIFDHVACSLTATSSLAWWVPGDAAQLLRVESSTPAPRVLRIGTDEDVTLGLLMRRAAEAEPWAVKPAGGPTSALPTGPHRLPADLVRDLRAAIVHQLGGDEAKWAQQRDQFRERLRTKNVYLQLRLDGDPDVALLTALRAEFPGFRFLIRKRDVVLPADADEVLLDVLPTIDIEGEWWGLNSRRELLEDLNLPVDHRVD